MKYLQAASVLLASVTLPFLTPTATAAPILQYAGTFDNTTGNDQTLEFSNWFANFGSNGAAYPGDVVNANTNPLTSHGASGGGDPTNGFLFHNGGVNPDSPHLWWTNELVPFSASLLDSFQVDLRNTSTTENLRFALQIGTTWYVSAAEVNNSVTNEWSNNLTVAIGSTNWNILNFNPGTSLAVGASSSLPIVGNVNAVGLFDLNKSSSNIRIDNFEVYAIPEPSSAAFLLIGLTALIGKRRKM